MVLVVSNFSLTDHKICQCDINVYPAGMGPARNRYLYEYDFILTLSEYKRH